MSTVPSMALTARRAVLGMVVTLTLGSCAGAADSPPTPASAPRSSTTGALAPADEAAPPRSVRLAFTGDMLIHDVVRERAGRYAGGSGYDFGPMLAEVAPIISGADLAICHQETPVSDDNRGLSGYPKFNAPRELAGAIRAAGYDGCDTASNHTVDLAQGGIDATLGTLDDAGLAHTGSARSAAEQAQPRIYDVKGLNVGHLAYTYGLNGLPSPNPYSVNLIDPVTIRADAARLRAAGADFVVASLHMGEEKDPVPSAYQEQVVNAVMAGPEVDLVIGHHAHVVQPAERRPDGRWVFFGLGNFLAQQEVAASVPDPPHRDGVIAQVTVTPSPSGWAVTAAGYVPTFVDAPSDVVRLAPDFSRERTVATLTSRGAPLADLTPR